MLRLAVSVLEVVVTRAQLVRLLEQVDREFLGRDRVEARLRRHGGVRLHLLARPGAVFVDRAAHARAERELVERATDLAGARFHLCERPADKSRIGPDLEEHAVGDPSASRSVRGPDAAR